MWSIFILPLRSSNSAKWLTILIGSKVEQYRSTSFAPFLGQPVCLLISFTSGLSLLSFCAGVSSSPALSSTNQYPPHSQQQIMSHFSNLLRYKDQLYPIQPPSWNYSQYKLPFGKYYSYVYILIWERCYPCPGTETQHSMSTQNIASYCILISARSTHVALKSHPSTRHETQEATCILTFIWLCVHRDVTWSLGVYHELQKVNPVLWEKRGREATVSKKMASCMPKYLSSPMTGPRIMRQHCRV